MDVNMGGIPQPAPQVVQAVDSREHTAEFDPKDISDNKVIAMCPYLFSVIGIIIALIASKESPFVSFHVRQAMKILICEIIVCVLVIIPFLGWFVIGVWYLISFVLFIIGFINVCCGKAKEIPIISSFKFLK